MFQAKVRVLRHRTCKGDSEAVAHTLYLVNDNHLAIFDVMERVQRCLALRETLDCSG